MARPPVQVNGLREFRRDLRRMRPQVDKELLAAIKAGSEKVAITAGAMAPRRSGALAHSIRAYVSGPVASVGSPLPYAGVVHFGGVIRPRGTPILFRRNEFITQAIRDHADEIVEDIGDAVEDAARRAGWH